MSDPVQYLDRRQTTGIEVKLDLLHGDVQDMKSVLKELTAAISRLAVVESDQGHIRAAQERGFKVLEKLEQRIAALEAVAVTSKQTNTWVEKALWAAAVLACVFIARRAGLM